MATKRRLNILESELGGELRPIDQWADPLASISVLNVTPGLLAGSPRMLSFVHNIMYDYAVARLLLGELGRTELEFLEAGGNEHLALSIRPSISLAFQRLWHASPERRPFWEKAILFVQSERIRMFGKVTAGDVASSEFREVSDVMLLIEEVEKGDEHAYKLLKYMIQAAIAHFRGATSNSSQLWGDGSPAWLEAIAYMAERIPDAVAGNLCAFLSQIDTEA